MLVITFIAIKIGKKNKNAIVANSIKTPLMLIGCVKK
jgi:predicted aspartyl protease